MRKLVFGMLAVAMVATPAMAELSRTGEIYMAELSADQTLPRAGTAIYNSVGRPGTFPLATAAAPHPGLLGWDDYDTISGVNLTAHQFAGGLTAISDALGRTAVMWMEFYNTTGTLVTTFGVAFPFPGNYVWTVTLGTPRTIPHDGFHQILANSTYTGVATTISGQWMQSLTSALVVGSNATSIGGAMTPGGTTVAGQQAFAFLSPEPTTLGLLGAGVLLILRRRR